MKKYSLIFLLIFGCGYADIDPNDYIIGTWKEVDHVYSIRVYSDNGDYYQEYQTSSTLVTMEGKWEWTSASKNEVRIYNLNSKQLNLNGDVRKHKVEYIPPWLIINQIRHFTKQ